MLQRFRSAAADVGIEGRLAMSIVLSPKHEQTPERIEEVDGVESPQFDDEIVVAESSTDSTASPSIDFTLEHYPACPHLWRQPFAAAIWLTKTLFAVASALVVLSVVASLPLLNFLALGYLLDAQGRVARTGRISQAVPLIGLAPRISSIVIGVWCCLLPLRLIATTAADAELIDPGSWVARNWRIVLAMASCATAVHLCLAIARGGRLTCFLRPIKNARWFWTQYRQGDYFTRAGEAVHSFGRALQLPYHFRLGLFGFAQTFAWIVFPTILFGVLQDTSKPGQVIITLIGGLMLTCVLAWAPFLQARFAAENRFGAGFDWKLVRELYRRRPAVLSLSVALLFALSLPLYIFKVAAPPRDAMWMMTIFFVPIIYPAKILVGFAYYWANRKADRAWFAWRWAWSLLLTAAIGFYVFLLFFTPAIGAYGRRVLFEHPALLLPSPF